MSAQPEGRLVTKILKNLNALPNCLAEKNHGTPYGHCKLDISGAVNGRAFHIEVKTPGNKPTKRQDATIRKWRAIGCAAGWATSPEEALEIIKPLTTEQ